MRFVAVVERFALVDNPAGKSVTPLRVRWSVRRATTATFVAVLSALLLVAAQLLPHGGWLAFVALVPLCVVLTPQRLISTWAILALSNAIYTALTLAWICRMGPGYGWVLLLASVYGGAWCIVPAASCWALGGAASVRLLALPAGWMLTEVLARHTVARATWALWGLPLTEWRPLTQAAALGGPELLSYLAVATNVAVALCFRPAARSTRVAALIQGPGLVGVALAWGYIHLTTTPESSRSLRVAVIQPNVSQEEKWEPASRRPTLALLDQLIDRTLADRPQIVVLPETAITGFVRYEDDLTVWVRGTVIRLDRPLLFGALDRPDGTNLVHNVAIMITPYDTVTTYAKVRLVPIGEFIPGLLTGALEGVRGDRVAAAPGSGTVLFRLREGITFATLICYEDIFPDLARDAARAGAELIVALINTQQFDGTSQPDVHLRRARLTAVAVGLPMLRCTNSGISCTIDANGRISEMLVDKDGRDRAVQAARVVSVALRDCGTLYRWGGDVMTLSLLGLLVIGAAIVTRTYTHATDHRPDRPVVERR